MFLCMAYLFSNLLIPFYGPICRWPLQLSFSSMFWAIGVSLRYSMTSLRSLVSLPSGLSTSIMASQDLIDYRATSSSTFEFPRVRLYQSCMPSRSSRGRPPLRLVSSPFHIWPFAVRCVMPTSTSREDYTACFPEPCMSHRVPGCRWWPLSRLSMPRRGLAFRCLDSTSSARTCTSWRLSRRNIIIGHAVLGWRGLLGGREEEGGA